MLAISLTLWLLIYNIITSPRPCFIERCQNGTFSARILFWKYQITFFMIFQMVYLVSISWSSLYIFISDIFLSLYSIFEKEVLCSCPQLTAVRKTRENVLFLTYGPRLNYTHIKYNIIISLSCHQNHDQIVVSDDTQYHVFHPKYLFVTG